MITNLGEFLEKNSTFAVIGASNNQEKYGYKVAKDLKDKGFHIIPVNSKENEILGLKVFHKISDIKEKVDVAIFIIPPESGLEVLKEIKKKEIKNAWFQPGSESQEIIDYCKENDIVCIYRLCIMEATSK